MTAAAVETKSLPRIVLIDLSSIYHPAWRANENGPLSVAFQRTIDNVWRCANMNPGSLVAICMDSKKSWRKELAPTYKAQREKLGNDFYATLDKVKERLIADGFLLWGAEGYEADDIVATATEAALALGHEVTIFSADKDLLQLMRPGVTQVRTHDWSTWNEEAMVAKFGVRPAQLGDWLALVGDPTDGVKGAPGVGAKTATDVLSRFGNLNALYVQISADPKNVGSVDGGKDVAKFVTAIDTSEADVRLARKLVDLHRNAPFDFREIYATRDRKPLVKTEDDMDSEDIPISRGPGAQAEPAQQAPEPIDVKEEPTPAPQPTQLSVIPAQPVEFERALEPRDPPGAVTLAKHLFNSRIYSKFPTWESVLATIIRGRSMGITSAAALDVFHIIDGKPYPYAYLIIHLAEKSPDCEYFYPVEASAKSATWETKHRRHPKATRVTFTIDQAELAGLLIKEKTGWRRNPEDMLVKSAGAKLARRIYPGATLGLISAEEMGDVS